MGQSKSLSLIVGLVVLLAASMSLFTIEQREKAIMFQLGEIVKSDFEPGLHVMIPFLNSVRKFDARVQSMSAPPERFLTSEKKNVVVDSFVKWRITDAARFYTATGGNVERTNLRLFQIVKDGLRDEFAKRTMQEVISGDRDEIMKVLTVRASKQAAELGVNVVQVRIKRIDLPVEVSASVYQRMEAERQRVAKELRSQGAEAAERIRAEADRQRTVLLAESFRGAETLRGEGDATASGIYGRAYGKNAEFYAFYRSLDAYTKTFTSKDDILVLDPSSDFFQYMMSATGRKK